jgi:hypothetical protein
MEWPLSAVEFDVLWREAGFGEPPYPIELASPGTTHAERASIVATALAGLAGRGIDREDVTDTLAMLVHGEVLVDGRVQLDEHVRLLATRIGDHAAVVTQRGEDLLVRRLDGARLGAALTQVLPQVPPAHGQSVSLSYRALTAALSGLGDGGSLWDFEQALKLAGVRGPDVRWFAGMVGGGGGAGAQFGVTARGHRLGLVAWYATADGGVLMQRHPDSDWVTVAPGDASRLVARLEELATAR